MLLWPHPLHRGRRQPSEKATVGKRERVAVASESGSSYRLAMVSSPREIGRVWKRESVIPGRTATQHARSFGRGLLLVRNPADCRQFGVARGPARPGPDVFSQPRIGRTMFSAAVGVPL